MTGRPRPLAGRLLRKVAEVSPRIAECVCETAVRRKVSPRDFVREFAELLAETPRVASRTSRR